MENADKQQSKEEIKKSMQQLQTKQLKGLIEVITGLHVGAGNNAIEIGGMDNPVVKNPVSSEPYIPGSSIKGKMRSLAEWFYGKMSTDSKTPGAVCDCGKPNCKICRVFGTNAARNGAERALALKRGPTRLIVRDAPLRKDTDGFKGDVLIEEKWENTINRITAVANPRQIERVVPGTVFDFDVSYRVMDVNEGANSIDDKYFCDVVLLSLYLLEHDYLGGGGSRGNGKIIFKSLKLDGREIKDAEGKWIAPYGEKIAKIIKMHSKTDANDANLQDKN
jgi:CRISPR-associated protein Csm3